MIKLQTGISTDMDFIKAMKEKGQDVSAEFPAETLRKQLDEVNEEVKVTFESTNETVLAAVNEGEEPTPIEEVVVTIDVNGLDEGDVATGTIGDEAITEFPAEITREKDTKETLTVKADGYITNESEVTFDKDKEITITLEKEPVPVEQIDFKSAVRMDVSGATAQDNPGIVENGDKYEVAKEGNTILVTDEGLIPYIGGNIDEPKKWVGILVDLGVKVQGTEYNIEDVDYSDAARWGAENDTTFIMWLTTEKGGEYTFTNLEDNKDKITITVEFAE